MIKSNLAFTLVFVSALALATQDLPADEDISLVFEKHVRPILKQHCFHCHGEEEETGGGLDLRLRRFLSVGGDSGAAIVPGNPNESLLVEVLNTGQMPEGKDKLPEGQIDLIAKWIKQGANTARAEPDNPEELEAFTQEERSWWSLQPIVLPPIPEANELTDSTNAIDRFVARSLKQANLAFSSEVDARTLIRRLHFDLTGLPPKPNEITTFTE